jgi:hypothetical protein
MVFSPEELAHNRMLRLQDCIRSNWPAITKNVHMDHMDDVYSVVPFSGEDPSELFEKASGWLILLHSLPQDQKSRVDVIERQLRLSMIDAVFGSNQIDGAGLDPHMTAGLCDRVFGGEDVKIINENTPGYETMLHFELCAHLGIGEDNVMIHDWASYIRQRTEVVNHAKAFQYIIDQVVSRDLPITQRLITTTHTILCQGTLILTKLGFVTKPRDYAGFYRKIHVGAGNTRTQLSVLSPLFSEFLLANISPYWCYTLSRHGQKNSSEVTHHFEKAIANYLFKCSRRRQESPKP